MALSEKRKLYMKMYREKNKLAIKEYSKKYIAEWKKGKRRSRKITLLGNIPNSTTRVCFRCRTRKNLDEFYKNITKPQGREYLCKKCRSEKTKLRKKKIDPEKEKARYLVHKAVKKGVLVKKPCIVCNEKKTEGHHEDYSKPLDVVWLCATHHNERHRIIRMVSVASIS